MKIADISIGEGHPLALIAGLNVLEDEASALECAEKVDALGSKHGLPTLFKASYDKANRTRADGFRGPVERGLAADISELGPEGSAGIREVVHGEAGRAECV